MEQNNPTKYPALNTISLIFKILGIITLILACIAFIATFAVWDDYSFDFLSFLSAAILLAISALIQFAFAELIKVIVDIEYNTRVKI